MNPTALVLLVLAIASEVAGTAGLKASEGFGRLGPSALAVLIWKEIIGPVHIVGIALIVVGVVVLNIAPGS